MGHSATEKNIGLFIASRVCRNQRKLERGELQELSICRVNPLALPARAVSADLPRCRSFPCSDLPPIRRSPSTPFGNHATQSLGQSYSWRPSKLRLCLTDIAHIDALISRTELAVIHSGKFADELR